VLLACDVVLAGARDDRSGMVKVVCPST